MQTGTFCIVTGVEMGATAQEDTLSMLSKDSNKDMPGSCTRACFLLWHLLRKQPGVPQTLPAGFGMVLYKAKEKHCTCATVQTSFK